MTTFYVGPGGSNASAGTSYATRWLTIAKLLGAAGMASGDTAYITPGTYRETVTVAMTSPVAETFIIGDVDGGHTSGVAGPVILTGYTTNDTSAPSGDTTLRLAARDHLTFRNLWVIGGSGGNSPFVPAMEIPAGSTDLKFENCYFHGGAAFNVQLVQIVCSADIASNFTFDRCIFFNRNQCVGINLTRSASADYDSNVLFRNCLLKSLGGNGVTIGQTGASAFFGGGVDVLNCTIMTGSNGVVVNAAQVSTSIPCTVNNTFISVNTTCLNANTSGQITESYCLLNGNTARTNVTAGTGSVATGNTAAVFSLGQEALVGMLIRPFGTPIAGSPMLGFGAGTSPPTVDLWNRDRPSGGASTNMGVGALERHDFGSRETGTVDTGTLAVRLTGPGDHQFQLPVAAGASRTISLKVYYDTNHATTNPPQAQLLANSAIGYAGETVTAAATTGSFLTLTFTGFTPTVNGVVTLRLRSRSAAANGYAIFDSVSVA